MPKKAGLAIKPINAAPNDLTDVIALWNIPPNVPPSSCIRLANDEAN